MDLRGLLVHMSEVASGDVTDHLDMWQQLQSDGTVRPDPEVTRSAKPEGGGTPNGACSRRGTVSRV